LNQVALVVFSWFRGALFHLRILLRAFINHSDLFSVAEFEVLCCAGTHCGNVGENHRLGGNRGLAAIRCVTDFNVLLSR
jgi:hypothetical protein